MSIELIALHTGLILDIAKIIDEYQKLYIYHIFREHLSWDGGYSEFIVVGESEDFVKYVHPNGSIINSERGILEYSKEAGIFEYNSETHAFDKKHHTKLMEHQIFNLYYHWPNPFWSLPEGIKPVKLIIKCIGQAIGDY